MSVNNSDASDQCEAVTRDSQNNVYCAGFTLGALGEANAGYRDAFIMKLNSKGVVQWITQLGAVTKTTGGNNAGEDTCYGIAIDSQGNVYCGGSTNGDIGETNGGSYDAFMMKLSSAGELQWVTQLGATTKVEGGNNSEMDSCYDIAIDSQGNVYCGGSTNGDIGETNGGSYDAFMMKLSSAGELQWVTQLGATTKVEGGNNSEMDSCYDIAIDSENNVYCGGGTKGALAEANGGNSRYDAFVMKLNSAGELQWVTQLGATTKASDGENNFSDSCKGITVDTQNNIYCAGFTESNMGEMKGGEYDAFIMKLNSAGELQWLTQLGNTTKVSGGDNSGSDRCYSIALDSENNIYCAGETDGALGEANGGSYDAFIAKFNSEGILQEVTQFGQSSGGNGSSFSDACLSVAIDTQDSILCAGYSIGSLGEANGAGGDDESEDILLLKVIK